MSITDTQSFSLVLRDAFLATLARHPFFQGFTFGTSTMRQRQPENIPYLGIYIIEEQMTPDGDLNAGDIRFIHSLRLGFSVLITNNDPDAAERKCDEAYWAIMNGLWRDAYLTNFLNTYDPGISAGTPDNVRFEGVERASRKFVFGNVNATNELPIGELQYDVAVRYRANYPPIITDDLKHVHVETVPRLSDPPERSARRSGNCSPSCRNVRINRSVSASCGIRDENCGLDPMVPPVDHRSMGLTTQNQPDGQQRVSDRRVTGE